MVCPRGLRRPVVFWPMRFASTSMRSPGLVATQTLTFLFADIEGIRPRWGQRLGDAQSGVLADYRPLIRASLAVHGGEEAGRLGW